ncbi:hypothetical protein FRC06_010864 [Ceratobasidium sp. 370]|nr:hypothetical protein FRC06_010864 [Ceratobasidium sp. 370]
MPGESQNRPVRKAGAPARYRDHLKESMPLLAKSVGLLPPSPNPTTASQPIPHTSEQRKKRKAEAESRGNALQPEPLATGNLKR